MKTLSQLSPRGDPEAIGLPASTRPEPELLTELEKFQTDYIAAFNAGDAKALAAMFTEDASVMNSLGQVLVGRAAITTALEHGLATPLKDARIELTPRCSRILAPGTVAQHGVSRTFRAGNPNDYRDFNYTKIFVCQDGTWRLALAHLTDPEICSSPAA